MEFESVKDLNDREIQFLMREIDLDDLVIAMSGASGETRERIYANMGDRARSMLDEEIGYMGDVPQAESEAAHLRIARLMLQLMAEGMITTRT